MPCVLPSVSFCISANLMVKLFGSVGYQLLNCMVCGASFAIV